MATYEYTPTDWETGQVISEELLDHIESGIANAYTALNTLEAAIAEVTASLANYTTETRVAEMIDEALTPTEETPAE